MNRPNSVSFTVNSTDAIYSINGVVAFVVDVEDISAITGWRVRLHRVRDSLVYVMLSKSENGKRTQVLLHRLLHPGCAQVDHKDGDGTNNRKSNLRAATHSQNMANAKRKTRSLPRGVRVSRYGGCFTARVKANNKEIHLGTFSSTDDAHAAYVVASVQHHKEFAFANREH